MKTIIRSLNGYPVEEHDVITEDGYILTMFHIKGKRKQPVFIFHGIADSADIFIIRGKTSLVIVLANAGYDVWVGNARGNKYGRRHVKLDADKHLDFWNFSFHEIGVYDLPAMIDYILQHTGEKKLQTIGHSQGTTTHYVLLSQRPEYNKKIELFIALAPVAFLADISPPVSTIAQFGPMLSEAFKSIGVEHVFPEKSPVTNFLRFVCSQDILSYEICFLLSGFYLVGFDTKRFEPEFLKVFIGHYPGGTSRKNLMHVNQLVFNKRFCEFDYGPKGNLDHYTYLVPPDYNLYKVTAKVALFVGENDALSKVKDVEIQRMMLPNIVYYHIMEDKTWNHIDFTVGNDMNVTLFPYIFKLLEKYK
ncbi:lipase 1-like [Leguminivora glycinivorella]|uniref:lipase 1-like n=1 Tax=Leguminivora glycinivorella TaxID=1035111 RepID=UPI00200F89E6|nr:lipase 1-like [Leguminivora glycinivorella]